MFSSLPKHQADNVNLATNKLYLSLFMSDTLTVCPRPMCVLIHSCLQQREHLGCAQSDPLVGGAHQKGRHASHCLKLDVADRSEFDPLALGRR